MARASAAREAELAALRQDAERRADEMRQVASGIAHEVRNPLAAIQGNAEWVERKCADEGLREVARKIRAQVTGLEAVVSRFLEYSRGFKPQLQRVDLADLLDAQAAAIAPEAARLGVKVLRDGEGALAAADPHLLASAVGNLCRNALQAMPKGGTLRLTAVRQGGQAVLIVKDSGPGLSPAVLAKLFEPFFTTREGGTGLGLALARRIAGSHGGSLSAADLASGGAAFTLTLPLFVETA